MIKEWEETNQPAEYVQSYLYMRIANIISPVVIQMQFLV